MTATVTVNFRYVILISTDNFIILFLHFILTEGNLVSMRRFIKQLIQFVKNIPLCIVFSTLFSVFGKWTMSLIKVLLEYYSVNILIRILFKLLILVYF